MCLLGADDSFKTPFSDFYMVGWNHLQPCLSKIQPRHAVCIVSGIQRHLQAMVGCAMVFLIFDTHDTDIPC